MSERIIIDLNIRIDSQIDFTHELVNIVISRPVHTIVNTLIKLTTNETRGPLVNVTSTVDHRVLRIEGIPLVIEHDILALKQRSLTITGRLLTLPLNIFPIPVTSSKGTHVVTDLALAIHINAITGSLRNIRGTIVIRPRLTHLRIHVPGVINIMTIVTHTANGSLLSGGLISKTHDHTLAISLRVAQAIEMLHNTGSISLSQRARIRRRRLAGPCLTILPDMILRHLHRPPKPTTIT